MEKENVYQSYRHSKEYSFWEYTCAKERYQKIIDLIPQQRKIALDVGCGSGGLCLMLAGRIEKVVGIDVSKILLSFAYRRSCDEAIKNVEFVNADCENLPFFNTSFDVVTSYRMLHHLDPDQAIPVFRSIVKPGGCLIVFDFISEGNRHKKPLWHIMESFKDFPTYYKRYGFKAAFRILKFRISKSWLCHVCSDELLSESEFRNIFLKYIPDCQFIHSFNGVIAVWQTGKSLNFAPGKIKS
jgi:ubiquinone/menaquinone biosynthesis C-methylase UbiE